MNLYFGGFSIFQLFLLLAATSRLGDENIFSTRETKNLRIDIFVGIQNEDVNVYSY
jgi:hypothetical protein